jgi:hypothetical protein
VCYASSEPEARRPGGGPGAEAGRGPGAEAGRETDHEMVRTEGLRGILALNVTGSTDQRAASDRLNGPTRRFG